MWYISGNLVKPFRGDSDGNPKTAIRLIIVFYAFIKVCINLRYLLLCTKSTSDSFGTFYVKLVAKSYGDVRERVKQDYI